MRVTSVLATPVAATDDADVLFVEVVRGLVVELVPAFPAEPDRLVLRGKIVHVGACGCPELSSECLDVLEPTLTLLLLDTNCPRNGIPVR